MPSIHFLLHKPIYVRGRGYILLSDFHHPYCFDKFLRQGNTCKYYTQLLVAVLTNMRRRLIMCQHMTSFSINRANNNNWGVKKVRRFPPPSYYLCPHLNMCLPLIHPQVNHHIPFPSFRNLERYLNVHKISMSDHTHYPIFYSAFANSQQVSAIITQRYDNWC